MTGKVNVWIMTVDGMWHAYDDNSIYMLLHYYVVMLCISTVMQSYAWCQEVLRLSNKSVLQRARRNASIDFYCYA